MSALVTAAHFAIAAEAVTSGPPQERDVVERVAQALADAEARAVAAAAVHELPSGGHFPGARAESAPEGACAHCGTAPSPSGSTR